MVVVSVVIIVDMKSLLAELEGSGVVEESRRLKVVAGWISLGLGSDRALAHAHEDRTRGHERLRRERPRTGKRRRIRGGAALGDLVLAQEHGSVRARGDLRGGEQIGRA